MTAASIGNWTLKVGTNASPEVLTSVEEVLDVSEFGAENELIDVTNWDTTVGEKEYIGGLADGTEFTVECNFVTGTTHQSALRADKGSTRTFELKYNGSTTITFTGTAVNLGWKNLPSTSEQNKVSFSFKVSGGITEA